MALPSPGATPVVTGPQQLTAMATTREFWVVGGIPPGRPAW